MTPELLTCFPHISTISRFTTWCDGCGRIGDCNGSGDGGGAGGCGASCSGGGGGIGTGGLVVRGGHMVVVAVSRVEAALIELCSSNNPTVHY